MKGLDTLIKLHKRSLDELRRKIVTVENEKQRFLSESQRLANELERELVLAGQQPEMGNFFGDFSQRIKTRREAIAKEVAKLDQKIAKLTDEAREAYGELKKFEIAKANIARRALKERDRKETIRLDEVAGQQDRRRKKENI